MRVRDVLLLLVLGALTSIAVAWGGMGRSLPRTDESIHDGDRAATLSEQLFVTVVTSHVRDPRPRPPAEPAQVPAWWSWPERSGDTIDVGVGWPFRCARAAVGGGEHVWSVDIDGLLAPPDMPFGAWFSIDSLFNMPCVLLPTIPIWSGLAADTLVYACAWLLPMFVLYGLRGSMRRRRRKALRCAGCGHSRFALDERARCAECGCAPDERTPWMTRTSRGLGLAVASVLLLGEASLVVLVAASPIVSPLHRAAHRGDVAAVDALLDAGAEVDEPIDDVFDGGGWTALRIAALAGHGAVCDRLWAAGAVDAATDAPSVAACAVRSGDPAMVQHVIDRGCRLSDERPWYSLLHVAAETNPDMVRFMLALRTWMEDERASAMASAIRRGDMPVVEAFLHAGTSAMHQFWDGGGCLIDERTPMAIAIQGHPARPALLPMLLEHMDHVPHAAFVSAVDFAYRDAIRLLVDAGADPNGTDERGRTVWWAASRHPDLWPYLLELGVDPNRPDFGGTCPADWFETRNDDLCRFLREHAAVPAVSRD